MSYNQEMIDFMNGTTQPKKTKKNSKNNNEKKYPTNQREDDLDDEEEIAVATHDDDDDDDVTAALPAVRPSLYSIIRMSQSPHQTVHPSSYQKSFDLTIMAWIDMDQQQIYPTVQSIYNLRQRIYHTHQFTSLLLVVSDANEDGSNRSFETTAPSSFLEWNRCGYRQRTTNGYFPNSTTATTTGAATITQNDLQMTIQHCLQHQERMIVQLRHLLSELSDMTNRMSRRYDDLYHHRVGGVGGGTTMEKCLVLYLAFAKELYRKQVLVTRMIDACTISAPDSDDVFGTTNDHDEVDDTDGDNPTENNVVAGEFNTERNHRPLKIARQCIQEWSYTSKYSYLYPYRQFVQECINRFQPSK